MAVKGRWPPAASEGDILPTPTSAVPKRAWPPARMGEASQGSATADAGKQSATRGGGSNVGHDSKEVPKVIKKWPPVQTGKAQQVAMQPVKMAQARKPASLQECPPAQSGRATEETEGDRGGDLGRLKAIRTSERRIRMRQLFVVLALVAMPVAHFCATDSEANAAVVAAVTASGVALEAWAQVGALLLRAIGEISTSQFFPLVWRVLTGSMWAVCNGLSVAGPHVLRLLKEVVLGLRVAVAWFGRLETRTQAAMVSGVAAVALVSFVWRKRYLQRAWTYVSSRATQFSDLITTRKTCMVNNVSECYNAVVAAVARRYNGIATSITSIYDRAVSTLETYNSGFSRGLLKVGSTVGRAAAFLGPPLHQFGPHALYLIVLALLAWLLPTRTRAVVVWLGWPVLAVMLPTCRCRTEANALANSDNSVPDSGSKQTAHASNNAAASTHLLRYWVVLWVPVLVIMCVDGMPTTFSVLFHAALDRLAPPPVRNVLALLLLFWLQTPVLGTQALDVVYTHLILRLIKRWGSVEVSIMVPTSEKADYFLRSLMYLNIITESQIDWLLAFYDDARQAGLASIGIFFVLTPGFMCYYATAFFGVALPIYQSALLLAIPADEIHRDPHAGNKFARWLMYWATYTPLCWVLDHMLSGGATGFLTRWIPFWRHSRLLLALWLQLPFRYFSGFKLVLDLLWPHVYSFANTHGTQILTAGAQAAASTLRSLQESTYEGDHDHAGSPTTSVHGEEAGDDAMDEADEVNAAIEATVTSPVHDGENMTDRLDGRAAASNAEEAPANPTATSAANTAAVKLGDTVPEIG